ncbi:MAG: hypothetical protein ACOCV2_10615, partial [Persicimonas sp.]
MHPLVARIHPSLRTAFFAWVVTRGVLWLAAAAAGEPLWVEPTPQMAEGAPGWSLLVHSAGHLDSLWAIGSVGAGTLAITAVIEAALLAALVGVYRFVRRDHLPAVAERATWLWAAFPAMASTLPPGAWAFAIAGVAICLGALSAGRHVLALAAMIAAMSFKPEVLLIWPGAALLGWKTYRPNKQPPSTPWLLTLGPPAAFSATVVTAMHLA